MKKFFEPSGYKILQELINSSKQYDGILIKNDLTALESLYRISAKLFLELSSHITNTKLSTANSELANACVQIAMVLENGGDYNDVADFVHRQVPELLAAEQ